MQRFCIFYALLRRGGGRRQTLSFAAAFPCSPVKSPHPADRGSGSWLPCVRGAGFLLQRSKKTEGLYGECLPPLFRAPLCKARTTLTAGESRLPCARLAPRRLRANLGSPVKSPHPADGGRISAPSPLTARASAVRSRTCGRQQLAFLVVSATGGTRKPTVQGELDFRLVYKPKRLRGCIPRQGIVFSPGLSAFPKKGKAKMCAARPFLRTKLPLRVARAGGFTFL